MSGPLGALVAGHCVADFVLQSGRMVQRKRDSVKWQLAHAGVVWFAHAVTLLVWSPGWGVLRWASIAALAHLGTDLAKSAADKRWPAQGGWWFALDQALHLGALVGIAVLAPETGSEVASTWMWLVSAYAFNVHGGGAIVALGLGERGEVEPASGAGYGQRIGVLERMILLTLVLRGEWAGIGFVLTAKSVARFKRLETDQGFAERYLVGTLTSVLVAGATGLALLELL